MVKYIKIEDLSRNELENLLKDAMEAIAGFYEGFGRTYVNLCDDLSDYPDLQVLFRQVRRRS